MKSDIQLKALKVFRGKLNAINLELASIYLSPRSILLIRRGAYCLDDGF